MFSIVLTLSLLFIFPPTCFPKQEFAWPLCFWLWLGCKEYKAIEKEAEATVIGREKGSSLGNHFWHPTNCCSLPMMFTLVLKGWCKCLNLSMLAVLLSFLHSHCFHAVQAKDFYRRDQLNHEHDHHIPESDQVAFGRHQMRGTNRSGKSAFKRAHKSTPERNTHTTGGSETKAGKRTVSLVCLNIFFPKTSKYKFLSNPYHNTHFLCDRHWSFQIIWNLNMLLENTQTHYIYNINLCDRRYVL